MRGAEGTADRYRLERGLRSVARRRLSPSQLAALRWTGLVFLASRVFVITVGVIAVLLFGTDDETPILPETLEPFGRLGDLLVAGSARWDSDWYVVIGSSGYGEDPNRAAFFPLYPLAIQALTPVTDPLFASRFGPPLAAGMIVSLTAFLVALYLLHRLVALDYGEPVARRTVVLIALFPTAFFFSAIYTEALFLALSVGAVYAARRSRWALAGVLGGMAALTRLPGVLLLVPLGLMLLYGLRGDSDGAARGGWGPRHRLVLKDALWLLLVPAGLLAFSIYGWLTFDDALATLHAQQQGWFRASGFPLRHAWWGLKDGASAINEVRLGADPFTVRPVRAAMTDAAFLVFAVVAMVGSLRRLPIAYAAYAPTAVLFALSSSVGPNAHLLSLPRFVVVLFPLFIWLALWTSTPRRWWLSLSVSVVLLASYTGLFATWHWVA